MRDARLHLEIVALTAALVLSCSKAPRPSRDFDAAPALLSLEQPVDLYAVGDPHGDVERLAGLLSAARLGDAPGKPGDAKWLGGPAVLVCTGDLIDKGPSGLAVIAYLRALSEGAAAAGGRVIVTMGNHEAEFLAAPGADKVSDFATELKAVGETPDDVAAGRTDLGRWLVALPLGVRVGGWFFSHAGNTKAASFDGLASALRDGIAKDGFGAAVLSADDSLLEARLGDGHWWDALNRDPEAGLASAAHALGAARFVQGHQPVRVTFPDGTAREKGTLFQKYGRIFLIDTGFSRGVGDSAGALLHVHRSGERQTATAIGPDGSETPVWEGPLP